MFDHWNRQVMDSIHHWHNNNQWSKYFLLSQYKMQLKHAQLGIEAKNNKCRPRIDNLPDKNFHCHKTSMVHQFDTSVDNNHCSYTHSQADIHYWKNKTEKMGLRLDRMQ